MRVLEGACAACFPGLSSLKPGRVPRPRVNHREKRVLGAGLLSSHHVHPAQPHPHGAYHGPSPCSKAAQPPGSLCRRCHVCASVSGCRKTDNPRTPWFASGCFLACGFVSVGQRRRWPKVSTCFLFWTQLVADGRSTETQPCRHPLLASWPLACSGGQSRPLAESNLCVAEKCALATCVGSGAEPQGRRHGCAVLLQEGRGPGLAPCGRSGQCAAGPLWAGRQPH